MSKNQNNRRIKIPGDAREFAVATFKKFKKHNDCFDSKKELKQSYNMYLIDLLPRTIEFLIRSGHIKSDEIQETKQAIYAKLVDEDFVKVLRKELKNGNDIDNIKLLPIIIKDILVLTEKENRELLAKDPNSKIYDMSDLIEISQLILKKRLKKFEKAGIDQTVAFDVLSVIPTAKALETSQTYRIHAFFEVLYEHAKAKAIPFAAIMNTLVDDKWFQIFIAFALLERKDKFTNLTDAQKTFYLDVSNWVFSTMEKLSKDEIEAILRAFVAGRKRDEAQGRDSNRRHALSSLPEADYPRIIKMVNKLISEDDTIKKYF